MPSMERTHRLRHDRAWLPRHVRAIRWGVTGGVWVTTGAAITGMFAVGGPGVLAAWKVIAIAGAAAAGAGERAGNAMLNRELARLAAGHVQLADLAARRDGELVVVRGRIACETPLSGLLVDAQGVYRRLIFKARGTWVHEAAVDFSLIDDANKTILVQVAGARWMQPARELVSYPGRRFAEDTIPRAVAQLGSGIDVVEAYEQVLAVGTEVQVVGYKTASADVGGEVVDYRLPPQRPTLRSGDDLPLVISVIDGT